MQTENTQLGEAGSPSPCAACAALADGGFCSPGCREFDEFGGDL